MGESVLFVHGTGVRGEGYARTLRAVGARLAEMADGIPLNGCFWGETEGARWNAGGISVPGYPESGGVGGPSVADRELALWAVLYTDPWYELRALAGMPRATELAPGTMPPGARLRALVDAFVPSAELLAMAELPWERALVDVRGSAEFEAATRTATDGDLGHVRAFARAVVASAATDSATDGAPDLHGDERNAIVERLVGELGGHGRGIGEWLTRQVLGFATRRVTRRRGALTDRSVLEAGDILRYQARGDGVRRAIQRSIHASGSDGVILLAHSLGGIACVDLLVRQELPAVRGLITVGSQAPFMYEIGALASLECPAPLPDHFPRWLNIYDRRDLLSYVGAELFPGRMRDVEVDNGQPFPAAHGAYWSNPATWSAVGEFLTR